MYKRFITPFIVVQLVLILSHVVLYKTLVFFFPFLGIHGHILFWVLMALSVSFVLSSVLSFKVQNSLVRFVYILSALWIPLWFYLLWSSIISLLVYLVVPQYSVVVATVSVVLSLALGVYGAINARIMRTTRVDVKLPNVPESWRGKTAVMVSDIHLGEVLRHGFAKKIVNRINKLKPEIVFIPGDFFDGIKTDFHNLARIFKTIKAPQGTYYVSGNHEQIAGIKICEDAIADAGIHVLENKKAEVNGLQIVGIAYQPESTESLRAILHSLEIDRTRPSIMLKHVPNHLDAAVESGISLQLSGHTHQGQGWPGRYITRRIFKGFDYGLQRINNFQIYTSSGVGTWGPPVRVFTKSEIVVLRFI